MCSRDLVNRPVIPFGGLGVVVKCDESKFNHKSKVRDSLVYFKLITGVFKSRS